MSQASCSCSSSQASLTSRISESTRAKSWSRAAVGGDGRSTYGSTPRSTRVLAEPCRAARRARRGGGPRSPRESEISLQGGAAAGPQLAVAAVAEELVGLPRRAGAGVEHGLAVLDDQHGVAGLVAGEVHVRGVGAEAVVGVVGAHLEAAGRDHEPLARERLGEGLRGGAADQSATGCRGRSSSRSPQPCAHEGGVGLGHRLVVRLGATGSVVGGCSFTRSLYDGGILAGRAGDAPIGWRV